MNYYIYAIVNGAEKREYGDIGIGGKMVYTIPASDLSAAVSELETDKLRPERRNLAAHQNVLNTLMQEGTPLPMAFGILTQSREAVETVLAEHQEALNEQLELVSGKMEMTLRVSWNAPNIFQYFVETYAELREARDRVYVKKHGPTQEDKIELGRLFDLLLQDDREKHTKRVVDHLSQFCHGTKEQTCRDERLVMNLSFLVDRTTEKEFENGIFEVANHFDNSYSFDYNGPLVPHNFVEMALELKTA